MGVFTFFFSPTYAWLGIFAGLFSLVCFSQKIEHAFFGLFTYLMIEGFMKMFSNYNPVVHVATDLLVVVLFLRSVYSKENPSMRKFTKTPFFALILLFAFWIFVQYLNPFGIGLIPSIAGTKVYISTILLFFVAYHHVSKESFFKLCFWIAVLGLMSAFIASYEYIVNPELWTSINQRYRTAISYAFSGSQYRPFGLTAVPGGASVWAAISCPLAVAYLAFAHRYNTGMSKSTMTATKILCILSIALSLFVTVISQVRVNMLIAILTSFIILLFPSRSFALRVVAIGITTFLGLQGLSLTQNYLQSDSIGLTREEKLKYNLVLGRLDTLKNKNAVTGARSSGFDKILNLAQKYPFGFGLSRVGAAAGAFTARNLASKHFKVEYGFSDNLFYAIFAELGVFGLVSYLIMLVTIVSYLFKQALTDRSKDRAIIWTASCLAVIWLIAGFGNEGMLYSPVGHTVWIFIGLGLREASRVVSRHPQQF